MTIYQCYNINANKIKLLDQFIKEQFFVFIKNRVNKLCGIYKDRISGYICIFQKGEI